MPIGYLSLIGCFLFAIACSDARSEERSVPLVDRVLLIMADDLRADVLGCYGDEITRTPHLDRLASESVVFDAAYCQATWCAPSRTSMMRSRYLDKDGPTLGEALQDSRMTTARVGKIFHMRVPGD
ncbi:unnamed protein product, partial [Hapterophycus canaliculatus]